MNKLIGKTIKHIEQKTFDLNGDQMKFSTVLTFTCTDGTIVELQAKEEYDHEESSAWIVELETSLQTNYSDAIDDRTHKDHHKEWGAK